ncbi:hypothetical protein [Nonomuraea candida]|uniref:hypothetical protein n=1 Tax=Nonomuraea candida TaxID=359159 RepID=UPI0005B7AE7E|nr:hypothetical protein [Nonomuraea candida]
MAAALSLLGIGLGLLQPLLLWMYKDDGDGGTSWFDEAVPASQVKDDWIEASTRFYSSDTVNLYVTPGTDAGPAPSPHPEPQWYDMPD